MGGQPYNIETGKKMSKKKIIWGVIVYEQKIVLILHIEKLDDIPYYSRIALFALNQQGKSQPF